MDTITIGTRHEGHRGGRPFLFSMVEVLVFALVAAALIATAAVPAMMRHPHYAEAKTVATRTERGR